MSWYYNTESGALTSAGAIQGFFQDLQSATGLAAGWHKLNIAATATGAQAAAEAKKEFPSGTAPTTSVATQVSNSVSQESTGSATTFSGLAGVATAIAKTGAVVDGLAHAITDGTMWRSLGWLLLGVVLIFIGIRLVIGQSVTGLARQVPGLPGRVAGAI
jgi:hypothetical protein